MVELTIYLSLSFSLSHSLYIYIYIYIYSRFYCISEKENKDICLAQSFYFIHFFRWESLVLGDIFSYSVVFSTDIGSLLSSKKNSLASIESFIKHSRSANQSHIVSFSSTTFWLISQSNALIPVCRRVFFPARDFNWTFNQTSNIRTWFIKCSRPRLFIDSFHIKQNQNQWSDNYVQRFDLLTPTGGPEM